MWKIQLLRKGQVTDGRPVYIGITDGKTREVHFMPDIDEGLVKDLNRAVKAAEVISLNILDVHHYVTVGV